MNLVEDEERERKKHEDSLDRPGFKWSSMLDRPFMMSPALPWIFELTEEDE